ncbi:HAD family hydrolase [Salinibacter altiplanensis]|uniref:HAD family hydrolase n=1 Tax=Salinibacter altiplanensis TaxID=1803181 RepID=UPI000C9FCFE1|nr:HAD family hydrolase [Salinibacter altiplanensis]
MALSCDAILFDLDGVLVDSEAVVQGRWRRWAEDRDIPFEEVEAVHTGRPAIEVIEEVAPHLDPETEVERLGTEMATDTEELSAFDGAQALLRRLPEDQWAIATSGRHSTATSRLAQVGLPEPKVLVTADDVDRGKPDPEPYRRAAEQLGLDPGRCVVLEDAPAGVEAARRAGASVLGVATAMPPAALEAATAVVPQLNAVAVHSEGEELRVDWRCHVETREGES